MSFQSLHRLAGFAVAELAFEVGARQPRVVDGSGSWRSCGSRCWLGGCCRGNSRRRFVWRDEAGCGAVPLPRVEPGLILGSGAGSHTRLGGADRAETGLVDGASGEARGQEPADRAGPPACASSGRARLARSRSTVSIACSVQLRAGPVSSAPAAQRVGHRCRGRFARRSARRRRHVQPFVAD